MGGGVRGQGIGQHFVSGAIRNRQWRLFTTFTTTNIRVYSHCQIARATVSLPTSVKEEKVVISPSYLSLAVGGGQTRGLHSPLVYP